MKEKKHRWDWADFFSTVVLHKILVYDYKYSFEWCNRPTFLHTLEKIWCLKFSFLYIQSDFKLEFDLIFPLCGASEYDFLSIQALTFLVCCSILLLSCSRWFTVINSSLIICWKILNQKSSNNNGSYCRATHLLWCPITAVRCFRMEQYSVVVCLQFFLANFPDIQVIIGFKKVHWKCD